MRLLGFRDPAANPLIRGDIPLPAESNAASEPCHAKAGGSPQPDAIIEFANRNLIAAIKGSS